MTTEIRCPFCGRAGRLSAPPPPGASVRCGQCKNKFLPGPSRGVEIGVIELELPAPKLPAVAAAGPSYTLTVAPAPAALLAVATPVAVAAPVPAPAPAPATKECHYCGETVLAVAKKCKHCAEILDPALRGVEEAKALALALKGNGGGAGVTVVNNLNTAVVAQAAPGKRRRSGLVSLGWLLVLIGVLTCFANPAAGGAFIGFGMLFLVLGCLVSVLGALFS
jgi:hypothetical protein